jgi:polygalacturonase
VSSRAMRRFLTAIAGAVVAMTTIWWLDMTVVETVQRPSLGQPTTDDRARTLDPPVSTTSTTLGGIELSPTTITPPAAIVGVNVRRLGAHGDGVADDTAAIQRAIDLAPRDPSRTVYLPSGVYLISDVLRYDSRIVITGDGMAATKIENALTRVDATTMLGPTRPGVSDVVVRDLSLDQRGDWYDRKGENVDAFLFDVGSTTGTTVQRVGFHNVRTMALYADTPRDIATVGLRVLDNRIFESNGGGFSFFGSLRDFVIAGNFVQNTKDDAIAVQDHAAGDYPTQITIVYNKIADCTLRTYFGSTPNGIMVYGADQVIVENNTISRVLASGIRAGVGRNRRGSNVTIIGNKIVGAGTDGPRDVPGHGIFLIGADHVLLRDNNVSGSRQYDYFAQDSTDITGP